MKAYDALVAVLPSKQRSEHFKNIVWILTVLGFVWIASCLAGPPLCARFLEGQQPGYSDNWSNQKLFRQFFQSAQIAVLTVPRQQAHHKLSFGIIFSPQLSTSGSGWAIQTMLFRQSELFRQFIFGTFFFCDPKITAFLKIKLLVFDSFFLSYCDLAGGAIQTIRLLTLYARDCCLR